MTAPRDKKHEGKTAIIGWRETIGLPDLGIDAMPAKIDTGARTSALHAMDQQVFERDGARWVSFTIPKADPKKKSPSPRRFEARIRDERAIKNTGGVPETRIVIRTRLRLGRRSWLIEASLANREEMEFELILGRTAIRHHGLLVDPGHSYVSPLSPPQNKRLELPKKSIKPRKIRRGIPS